MPLAMQMLGKAIAESGTFSEERIEIEEADIYTPEDTRAEEDYDKTEIIAEDVSKRTETSKTFIRADGAFLMQDYGMPVHYLEGDAYVNINNRINSQFENVANSFKVTFDDGTRENLISVTSGGTSVSMTPVNAQKPEQAEIYVYDGLKNITNEKSPAREVPVNYKKLSGNLEDFNIKDEDFSDKLTDAFDNLSSSVLYADLYDGIDIQYILEGKSLKENIIVNYF